MGVRGSRAMLITLGLVRGFYFQFVVGFDIGMVMFPSAIHTITFLRRNLNNISALSFHNGSRRIGDSCYMHVFGCIC